MAEKIKNPAEYIVEERLVTESIRRRSVADFLAEVDPSEGSNSSPTQDLFDPEVLRSFYVQYAKVDASERLLSAVASAMSMRGAYKEVSLDEGLKPDLNDLPPIETSLQLSHEVKLSAMQEGIELAQTAIGSYLVEAFNHGGEEQQPLERWKRQFVEKKLPKVEGKSTESVTVFAQETVLPGVTMELEYTNRVDIPKRTLTVYPLCDVLL